MQVLVLHVVSPGLSDWFRLGSLTAAANGGGFAGTTAGRVVIRQLFTRTWTQ